MAGPYHITVIRHDLSRELIAAGLTAEEMHNRECDRISDETVLNFETEYYGPPA